MNRARASWPREAILITIILLVGLVVRLAGVFRGLPYIHEWDEPFVMTPVLRMFLFHTLNPGFFTYPSLYYYLLLPVVYLHYGYLHVQGLLSSTGDIILAHPWMPAGYVWYVSHPSFYLWARVFTALLGTVTIYLLYRIGRATFGTPVGLLAAAVLAVAPGAVYYADTVRVDIPVTMFVCAAMLAGLGVLQGGRLRDYVLAGLLGGLAISTKQTVVWIVLSLGVAHLCNPRRMALVDRRLGAMALCAAAGFLVGTPYILIRPNLVWGGFAQGVPAYGLSTLPSLHSFLARLAVNLAYIIRPSQGGDWYVVPHAGMGGGLLLGIAAAWGLCVGFRWAPRVQLYLISFVLPLPLFLSIASVFYFRNLMPVLPFVALWAAAGTVWVWQRIGGNLTARRPSWRPGLAVLGIAILLFGSAREAVDLGRALSQDQDTRTAAVNWLLRQAPRGAGVAFELELAWFLPDLDRLPFRVEFTTRDTDLTWYAKQRIDFAVVSDQNPAHLRRSVVVFSGPPYLPSPVEEARFIPNSYPIIDPKITIVTPRAP